MVVGSYICKIDVFCSQKSQKYCEKSTVGFIRLWLRNFCGDKFGIHGTLIGSSEIFRILDMWRNDLRDQRADDDAAAAVSRARRFVDVR